MNISTEYVEEMLHALRISNTEASSAEVEDLISAAVADLGRQGVKTIDLDDALTKQAVKLYCKAHYGYDKDTERFDAAYTALSAGMALCGDYDGSDDDA